MLYVGVEDKIRAARVGIPVASFNKRPGCVLV